MNIKAIVNRFLSLSITVWCAFCANQALAVPFDVIAPTVINLNTNASAGIGAPFPGLIAATSEVIAAAQFTGGTISVESDNPNFIPNAYCCFNTHLFAPLAPNNVIGQISYTGALLALVKPTEAVNPNAQWGGMQLGWPANTNATANVKFKLTLDGHSATFTVQFRLFPFSEPYTPLQIPAGAVQRITAQRPDAARTVMIDVKPESTENTINLGSNGVFPVAIFGASDFDVTSIDLETISLSGATVNLIGKANKYQCSYVDINNDGVLDLVCNVQTNLLTLKAGDTVAVLTARTVSGKPLTGQDAVRIVP
jgi:hypothetical protein